MRTEVIEWFSSSEAVPAHQLACLGKHIELQRVDFCFYDHELKLWCWMLDCEDGESAPPDWWAHVPKGPQ